MSVLAMQAATKQATVTANGLPHSTTPEHKEAQQSMGVISAARFRELGVTVHCDVPCVNRDELFW
jgi:protein-tyrosine phosphatase